MEGKTPTEVAQTPIPTTSTSAIASPSTPSDTYSVSSTSTNNSYITAPLTADTNKKTDSTTVHGTVVEKAMIPTPPVVINEGNYQITYIFSSLPFLFTILYFLHLCFFSFCFPTLPLFLSIVLYLFISIILHIIIMLYYIFS